MKEKSKEFLTSSLPYLHAMVVSDIDEYLDEFPELTYGEHNVIIDLYTMYTTYEIDDYNHIIEATNEFFEFLTNSQPYQNDTFVKDSINRAQRIVTRLVNKFMNHDSGSSFAKAVLELSPSHPSDSHILDVGPGFTPYSSLYLANTSKKVSALDKDYLFSIESLSEMNVDAKKEFFSPKTAVDDYDFIVGCRPCTAIPYVVSQCKDSNKPYFLQLCDCSLYDKDMPILNAFAKKGKMKWTDILTELDPNIKFYEDFAFNIDATPEQVQQIISQRFVNRTPSSVPKMPTAKFGFTTINSSINETDWKVIQQEL